MGKKDKICKKELVVKLTSLFKKANAKDIDEAVQEAKNQLTVEVKKAKRKNLKDLEKLFNSQIQTLKERGCPEQIIILLTVQKNRVLSRASKMIFKDGHIPFIPVIPRTYRSIYDLIAMVWNNDKQGYTYLNPMAITDRIRAPDRPYYIFDVEDGEALLDMSPGSAEKTLKSQKRSPLTVAEVVALCIHTDVLSRHDIWATGSRYDKADVDGELALDVFLADGAPELGWTFVDYSDDSSGSASCRSRCS